MSIDRRHFIKGILGSGLIAFSTVLIKPISETLEGKIQRLFAKHPTKGADELFASLPNNHALTLLEADSGLLQLSDKAFIKMIEKNISQDFSDGRIIDLAGWQLSDTEVSVISIIKMGAGDKSIY